jgi:hypothetical protein
MDGELTPILPKIEAKSSRWAYVYGALCIRARTMRTFLLTCIVATQIAIVSVTTVGTSYDAESVRQCGGPNAVISCAITMTLIHITIYALVVYLDASGLAAENPTMARILSYFPIQRFSYFMLCIYTVANILLQIFGSLVIVLKFTGMLIFNIVTYAAGHIALMALAALALIVYMLIVMIKFARTCTRGVVI